MTAHKALLERNSQLIDIDLPSRSSASTMDASPVEQSN
ncbi:hypothetical protein BTZ20_5086 [Rhodococcus sp. MTM3W5.2]|nr:hypothetical protein BTZ20_5086 [Rhodococcus sp. MTM3W5.2]